MVEAQSQYSAPWFHVSPGSTEQNFLVFKTEKYSIFFSDGLGFGWFVNYFSKCTPSQVSAGTGLILPMGTAELSCTGLVCRGIFFPFPFLFRSSWHKPWHSPGHQSCCHHLHGNPFLWDLTKCSFNSKTSFEVTIWFWGALIETSQSCLATPVPRMFFCCTLAVLGWTCRSFSNLNNSVN